MVNNLEEIGRRIFRLFGQHHSICGQISSLGCIAIMSYVFSIKVSSKVVSKAGLFIAAVLVANAMVLYLSMTDHSPDYLHDMSASEQVESSDPQL